MPIQNNIECFVLESDGLPLREYADSVPQLATTYPSSTVYIEAKDGKEFQVSCKVNNSFEWPENGKLKLQFLLMVDGTRIGNFVTEHEFPSAIFKGITSYKPGGTWECRKLLFSTLHISGDTSESQLENQSLENLGEIKIFVTRVLIKRSALRGKLPDNDQHAASQICNKVVDEKAAKGLDITHYVKYGEATICANPICVKGTELDSMENPYMVFRFLYRSRSALQSLGLIPRTPIPELTPEAKRSTPPLMGNEFDYMTPKEMKEMLERYQTQFGSLDKLAIKREREASPSMNPNTKTEPGQKEKRAKSTTNTKVKIDLTLDD